VTVALFDLLLAAALLFTAWRAMVAPGPFRAVLIFIVFGLLMALAWVRLAAPDIALAEAAIGAGLTGALLLDAVGHLRAARCVAPGRLPTLWVGLLSLLLAAAFVILFWAIPEAPAPVRLAEEVAGRMDESGVAHPVTAVLLNFRGWDTLLEVGVLLVALLAMLAAGATPERPAAGRDEPVLRGLAHLLTPLMVLTAFYLLWAGSDRPGGAFQGAAVLAAAGVLLRLAGPVASWSQPELPLRAAYALGFSVFLAVAAAGLGYDALLRYPPEWAGGVIFAVESALLLSLGAILAGLFLSGPQARRRGGG